MARINVLTAKQVAGLPPGRHSDGGNLYLVVSPSQTRRWAFMYRAPIGTQREMGLGAAGPGGVTLAMARELAREARAILQRGGDPIDARKAQSRANGVPTFGTFADSYIAEHKSAWKNEKHIAQWQMTLTVHAKPLRAKRLDEITTTDVLEVLRPIWTRVPETARRLRARIEKLLDAAKATGHRTGDNPARWRGHLDHLLPRNKPAEEGHHAALPYMELPTFVAQLRARPISPATLGLEYLILTAARTQEVLGAPWSEFDIDGRTWTVPLKRMKGKKEHRVPLSDRALEILGITAARRRGQHPFVFPGQKRGEPMSDMSFLMLLRRMGRADITAHGFRSAFRDWCAEETDVATEVAEMSLAHAIPSKVERAYRRGDLFEKRKALMNAWAAFVTSEVA